MKASDQLSVSVLVNGEEVDTFDVISYGDIVEAKGLASKLLYEKHRKLRSGCKCNRCSCESGR